jgi:hypothetical protein
MKVLRHITEKPIRVALALSLLIHAAALVKMPALHLPKPETTPIGPLIVQLEPRARAAPAAPRRPVPPPRPPRAQRTPAPAPRTAARPPPRPRPPPVIARSDPAPAASRVPRPTQPPGITPAPAATDLGAYVESRRLARDERRPTPLEIAAATPPATTMEDENTRANRIAAANLGVGRKPEFGPERKSGGVFDPTYISYDYAEFIFYGWNKDISRNTAQKIEVRKGSHSDIQIAVVRRMIAIIRQYEKEDFVWQSHRLNRDVTLSARLRDNAGLEDFLMQEFFPHTRRPAASP